MCPHEWHGRKQTEARITMTADDLVERCLAGEQAAWSALVDRYAGLVYAIARTYRLDQAACEDVSQFVFSSLVRRLGELRETRALPGWITTTTKRECWRLVSLRRREQEAVVQDLDRPVEPVERLAAIENAQRIREGLSELGGRCQKLLTLLYLVEGMPDYHAVSRAMDIPVGSIGPTRARCLAKLARILGPDG